VHVFTQSVVSWNTEVYLCQCNLQFRLQASFDMVYRSLQSLVLQRCWHHLISARGVRKRHTSLWWSITIGQRFVYLWKVTECWASSRSWPHSCCKSGWVKCCSSPFALLLFSFLVTSLACRLVVVMSQWLVILSPEESQCDWVSERARSVRANS
jgi:hypothetical protein